MNDTIRCATVEDLDELVRIEQAAFDPRYYPITCRRQFRYLLTQGQATLLVADHIVADHSHGLSGLAVLLWRKTSAFGRLYSIAVDPAFQGGAIGKALFLAAEQTCRQHQRDGMVLEIRADNSGHQQRYLRSGYCLIKRLTAYYPDGMDGLKMKKRLT